MKVLIKRTFSTDDPEHTYLAGAIVEVDPDFGKSIIAKELAVSHKEPPVKKASVIAQPE